MKEITLEAALLWRSKLRLHRVAEFGVRGSAPLPMTAPAMLESRRPPVAIHRQAQLHTIHERFVGAAARLLLARQAA